MCLTRFYSSFFAFLCIGLFFEFFFCHFRHLCFTSCICCFPEFIWCIAPCFLLSFHSALCSAYFMNSWTEISGVIFGMSIDFLGVNFWTPWSALTLLNWNYWQLFCLFLMKRTTCNVPTESFCSIYIHTHLPSRLFEQLVLHSRAKMR